MLSAHPKVGATVLVAFALVLTGCGKPKPFKSIKDQLRQKVGDKVKPESNVAIDMANNKFTVDDEKGLRLLDADVKQVQGNVTPGKGIDSGVKMLTAKCRLYKEGKLQMVLDSPEATWDGERLVSQKPVHAVSAENDKIIDAQSSVWHAKLAKLDMVQAKMQSLTKGKLDMTTEAPTATLVNNVATMPKGATGVTPTGDHLKGNVVRWFFGPKRIEANGNVVLVNAKGSQVNSDTMKWMLSTGKVEADGNVVLTEDGTRVTGQRLRADVKLKQGRVSGRSRVVMTRSILAKQTPVAKKTP